MTIVGIVAEYNPFHNGHLYHLKKSKDVAQADAAVCVMSGNFTQRGEPALVNKWARAEMALRQGMDLVFELPTAFAVRSAYYFAKGAVLTLAATGMITHLSFGSESGNISLLDHLAQIISREPDEFRAQLKHYLDQGLSYPLARSKALQDYLEQTGEIDPELSASILNGPNNILALEYLRVLKEEKLSIKPLTIKRIGSNYHDNDISEFPSATAVRYLLQKGTPLSTLRGLPLPTREILAREQSLGHLVLDPTCYDAILLSLLRRSEISHISQIYEVAEGLENRIKQFSNTAESLHHLLTLVKTKRYSLTRLKRIVFYILVNLTSSAVLQFDKMGPKYLRLLGFSPHGQKILQEMKRKSSIPIISNVRRGLKELKGDATAEAMLKLDILATDLYVLLQPQNHKGGLDYRCPPVKV